MILQQTQIQKYIIVYFRLDLCLEEYITNNSIDCFIILSYSTLIWTFIEFLLHISNTRNIKPMFFYTNKNNSIIVPHYLSIFLQGFQEGSCITTIGLYFGDRIFSFKYVIFLHLLIAFIIINVCNQNKTKKHTSIRHVNTTGSLLLMAIITLYDIKLLYESPHHLHRQLSMLFVMIYVSFFWTITIWCKGFREVVVYIKDQDDKYIIKKFTLHDTIKVLIYDIIFEIGMVYLFFYRFLN